MLSSKLLSLLGTFSRADLNQFGKYLESPFLNENTTLVNLFRIVESYLREERPAESMQKQQIWAELNPDLPYQDPIMRRLSSDLTKMAYSYLAYRQYKAEPFLEQNLLLQAIKSPELEKHFNGIIRQVQQQQEKRGLGNRDFHYLMQLVSYHRHEFEERTLKKNITLNHAKQSDYHLDCYYILSKLKNYCDLLGYSKFLSTAADIDLFPDFLAHVRDNYLDEPAIHAFYLVTNMLLEPEEESHFYQLKSLVKNLSTTFQEDEMRTLFTHLKNYCIDTKINTGRDDYFQQLFQLFKMQIETGLILENENISPQNYKNIISVGLHLKVFDWVEEFIQDFTDRLPKENQDNDRIYNLAKVYFYSGDYERVIEQLREVEYRTLVHSLGGKLLLLKTYYELKEYIAMDSLLDSFRIYLRRNRHISREVKQQYLNVLRFIKKLSNIRPGDRQATEKIQAQIQKCKAVAAKRWLSEKADEQLKVRSSSAI